MLIKTKQRYFYKAIINNKIFNNNRFIILKGNAIIKNEKIY